MTSREILKKYLDFYKARGHAETPNVSLVPEGDSTLLFVNSGMFPLAPYLGGEPHPLGKRLVNVQRSMRFDDLEEVGDYNHTTAFHMLGNWSLGDYFKSDQLPWVYEFFIKQIGLDPNRLFASVFEGDENAPRDNESVEILKKIFKQYNIEAREGQRIFLYDQKENWWQRGEAVSELGGPDSEIFYYVGEGDPAKISQQGRSPAKYDAEFLEIGNSVFMQFRKTAGGWEELPQKNVDFGGGLERIALAAQGKKDIFETDNFWPVVEKLQQLSDRQYRQDDETTRAMRILTDHIRAATFLAMDGVVPSNKDQGYALRRFLRRMVRFAQKLGIEEDISVSLIGTVVETFEWLYPQLSEQQASMSETFREEEHKFAETLRRGGREVEKRLSGFSGGEKELAALAFDLYQSVGYPPEMLYEDSLDLSSERNARLTGNVGESSERRAKLTGKLKPLDTNIFWSYYKEELVHHQAGSRAGAEQKFKGGLADHSEQVVKYHTATHLLHYALRQVLGSQVMQRGSNITGERLRFDFSHEQKLSEDELRRVEEIVNEKIAAAIPVKFEMMPKEEAEKTGAIHAFGEKYGDQVKIYYIGDTLESAFSKEFCGGPHVANTGEIGLIEVYKQETVGKGARRIYARVKS